jgi:rubrerythrin
MKNSKSTFLKVSRSIALMSLIIAIALSSTVLFAQGTDVTITQSKKGNNLVEKKIQPKLEKKVAETKVESIVREGRVNFKKIDANKDGKVFQCEMDKNVISDVPGKCPICGMTLKEVTIKEAKANLKDFKPKPKTK